MGEVLARVIQLFMPRVSRVGCLDLFADANNHTPAKRGRTRSTQTALSARHFTGIASEMKILDATKHKLHIHWQHPEAAVTSEADMKASNFTVSHAIEGEVQGRNLLRNRVARSVI